MSRCPDPTMPGAARLAVHAAIRTAGGAALALGAAAPAGAQSIEASRPVPARESAIRESAIRAGAPRTPRAALPLGGPGDDDRATAARVVAHPAIGVGGAPGALRVIAVAVPDLLPADRALGFRVTPVGGAPVLGRLTGALPAGVGRTLRVTVGIPRSRRAGRHVVAIVRFGAPGLPIAEVPVEADVPAVHRLAVRAPGGLVGAAGGTATTVRWELANAGNAPDTVRLALTGPSGWTLPALAPVVLAAGERRVVTVPLRVPRTAGPGVALLHLAARSRDAAVAATGDATIEVIGGDRSGDGPLVTVGASAVAVPGGAPVHAQSLDVAGAVTPTLHVAAQATLGASGFGAGQMARARLGLLTLPPSLQLTAPAWNLRLGTSGLALSDLAGVNLGGRGATLGARRGRWTALAVAAAPDARVTAVRADGTTAAAAPRGTLAGVHVEARAGVATLTGGASHLREGGAGGRALDALSVGAALPAAGGTVAGELATRRRGSAGAAVLGWAVRLDRPGRAGGLSLRLAHAPGGSSAFARATDELLLTGGRRFGRTLSGNVGAWRTADAAATGLAPVGGDPSLAAAARRAFRVQGAASGLLWQPRQAVALAVDLRTAALAMDAGGMRYDSDERGAGATLTLRRGRLYASGGGSETAVRRTAALTGAPSVVERAPRTRLRGAVGLAGAAGTVELGTVAERGGPAGPGQWREATRLRVDELPVGELRGAQLTLGGSLELLRGVGGRQLTERVGARLALPAGLSLRLAAERSPWFVGIEGRRWVTALSVERALRLPRLRSDDVHGRVVRAARSTGADAAGVAGVVVRRGFETAVTDADGRFTFRGPSATPIAVDARSLPDGVVAGPVETVAGAVRVPLVALAPVRVRLALDSADAGRVSAEALARAVVQARDAQGTVWVARADGATAVFDALPPGHYALTLDLADVGEPLRPVAPLPAFDVAEGRTPAELRVALRGRPVRVRVFGEASGTLVAPTAPATPAPVRPPSVARPAAPAAPALPPRR